MIKGEGLVMKLGHHLHLIAEMDASNKEAGVSMHMSPGGSHFNIGSNGNKTHGVYETERARKADKNCLKRKNILTKNT